MRSPDGNAAVIAAALTFVRKPEKPCHIRKLELKQALDPSQ